MQHRALLSFLIGLVMIATSGSAQTEAHRLGIAAGGGPQDYLSQVGNGFKLGGKDNSWHGAGTIHVGSYINRSLDLVFSGTMGDLSVSRLLAIGVGLKYKIANDRLLPENSFLKPYVYVGAGFNHLSNRVAGRGVEAGNYFSLNAGLGARAYVTPRISIGYNLGLGFLILERINPDARSRPNELFLHNAILLGIDVL